MNDIVQDEVLDSAENIIHSNSQARSLMYREFIKEAFIVPIRTAVIVDDEFPTLDHFLNPPPTHRPNLETDKAKKIIDFCRNQKPHPWIVDIHDGRNINFNVEKASANHFDHTDLLILDYHLDGSDGSEKAISILRGLASNQHFNLVVIYTNIERIAGGAIHKTLSEISLALMTPSGKFKLNLNRVNAIRSKFSAWELLNEEIETILLESIDETTFQFIISREEPTWDALKSCPQLSVLANHLNNIPSTVDATASELFLYIIHKIQDKLSEKMSAVPYGKVSTHIDYEDGTNWIHLDTLFITIVPKSTEANEIPEKLLCALESWNPNPHRLLMSKMRVELGQNGIGAEIRVLDNIHLQAAWLKDILELDDAKRQTNVYRNIARHWESLGDEIKPNIFSFASKIAGNLIENTDDHNKEDQILSQFNLLEVSKQSTEVFLESNSFACSKPIEGHHLTTGQIIRICEGRANCSLWLVLSPACDLVPGQNNSGWKRRLGGWAPFKAIRIFQARNEDAIKKATQGLNLFLNIDGRTNSYGFSDLGISKQNETLSWEQFFSKNNGMLNLSTLEISIKRIKSREDNLEIEEIPAKVVAQLRYEYALNLLQKLGNHLSRIGLDFTSHTQKTS